MYSLTALEARSLKSRCWQGCASSKDLQEERSLPLPVAACSRLSLACSLTSISAVFTWPPPACLCLLFCFLWGHLPLDLVPTQIIQNDLISRSLMWLCLQRPFFQIGSLSEIQRAETWTCLSEVHHSTPSYCIRPVGLSKITDYVNRRWLQLFVWRSLTILPRLDIGLYIELMKELTQYRWD